MSDHIALLLILAGLHMMESCQIVPEGSVVFRARWWARYAVARASDLMRVNRGRFVLLNPLDTRAHLLVTGLPHLLPTADGILDVTPEDHTTSRRRPFVPWSAIGAARAVDADLVCPGLGAIACGSEGTARLWARGINALRTASPARRARLADGWLRLRFSPQHVRRRLSRLQRGTRPLDAVTMTGFVVLLGGAFVITQRVSELILLTFLGAGVLFGCVNAVMFLLAHARLREAGWPQRLGRALMLVVCFPVSFRARSSLGRFTLAAFHPVAVAAVATPPQVAQVFIAQSLRRWQHRAAPPPPGSPDERHLAQAARAVEAAIHAVAGTLPANEPSQSTPTLRDPAIRSWCPRCHATYVHQVGTCHECAGVPLIPVRR